MLGAYGQAMPTKGCDSTHLVAFTAGSESESNVLTLVEQA